MFFPQYISHIVIVLLIRICICELLCRSFVAFSHLCKSYQDIHKSLRTFELLYWEILFCALYENLSHLFEPSNFPSSVISSDYFDFEEFRFISSLIEALNDLFPYTPKISLLYSLLLSLSSLTFSIHHD